MTILSIVIRLISKKNHPFVAGPLMSRGPQAIAQSAYWLIRHWIKIDQTSYSAVNSSGSSHWPKKPWQNMFMLYFDTDFWFYCQSTPIFGILIISTIIIRRHNTMVREQHRTYKLSQHLPNKYILYKASFVTTGNKQSHTDKSKQTSGSLSQVSINLSCF